MKLLTENVLKGASFSSVNLNVNFPLSSLTHQFLRYKYKSLTQEDVITIVLADNESVNSCWYGFSNAISMVVTFKDHMANTLKVLTVDCSQDNGAEHFATLENVRTIIVDVEAYASDDLVIGGLAAGMALDMPLPTASFVPQLVDNGERIETEAGQVMTQYSEPRTVYELAYAGVLRDDFREVIDAFHAVGQGHVWVDITEENHALHKPLYCTTNLFESPARNDGRVSFRIKYTEAR